jgi:hypothetical protein
MPVSSVELLATFKTYYTPDQMESLLWRNSPAVKKMTKVRVTGADYVFPMVTGRGGAVSGSGAVAVAKSAITSRTNSMRVQHGNIFSAFQLTDKEARASIDDKGAFEPVGVTKLFTSSDALRKTVAASFYGSAYGEVGRVQGTVIAGAASFIADSATIAKIDVDSDLVITTGPVIGNDLPSDALIGGGTGTVYTVTQIDGNGTGSYTVTFTPVAPAAGFVDQSWICLNGFRDATNAAIGPMGLGGALPSFANRTGGNWTTYIATLFQGLNRSTFVNRLAGGFVLQNKAGAESMADTVTRAVQLARYQGSEADLVILNDYDYAALNSEMNTNRFFWQSIQGNASREENTVARGIGEQSYMFSNSWVKTVIDDPYCPVHTFYVLELRTIKWIGLTDMERATQDGISDNQPGAPPVTQDGKVPTDRYGLNIDDILTLNPAAVGQDGAAIQGLLTLFGSWVVQNPAHCCVGVFQP